MEGLTLEDLSRQLDVNVTAQIGVTHAVLPKIRAAKGSQVNSLRAASSCGRPAD